MTTKTTAQLMAEAKELLCAFQNALQIANEALARCDRMKPDPKCQVCGGTGRVEYMAHDDLHFGDCKCRSMTIKLPITI